MSDWSEAPHLLCVQLGSVAEVLACTPALRALRAQCPDRRVTLLASPAGAALGPHLPDVDTVFSYEAPWLPGGAAASPASHIESIARLAAQRFDGAVIFTACHQSALPAALLCQLAGIPLRAGWCRDDPSHLLTHWIADPEPGAMQRHPVQRQLDLVRRLGAEVADERLAFLPSLKDLAGVRTRLHAAGIEPAGRWMVLHPGASEAARRFPPREWSGLIRALSERIACPLVLTGGAHEHMLIDAFGMGSHVHSLADRLDIGQTGALLAEASLVISSNPETTQLACAAGTPVVALHARADPRHTPWRVAARVLDFAAGTASRDSVADAVCSLLKESETGRATKAAVG